MRHGVTVVRWSVLLMVVVLVSSLAQVSCAEENGHAVAWRAAHPLKIDGDLSEWDLTAPVVLERVDQVIKNPSYWNGPDDCSGRFYLMWDTDNLYLGADVVDDVPFVRFMAYGLDSIDAIALYLSTNPSATQGRTLYESTDFRVLFAIDNDMFDTGIDRSRVLLKKGIETRGLDGYEAALSGYQVALRTNERGYTLEMKVPFSNFASDKLPLFTPKTGVEVGFNLELIDLDQACPGSVASAMVWKVGNPMLSPKDWGTLRFETQ